MIKKQQEEQHNSTLKLPLAFESTWAFKAIIVSAACFTWAVGSYIVNQYQNTETLASAPIFSEASLDTQKAHPAQFTRTATSLTTQASAVNQQAFERFSANGTNKVNPGPLPRSLRGSSHDFHPQLTASGDLIIDETARGLFDFYLAAIDEEALEIILLRINLALENELSGKAFDQASELLRNYINYKIVLTELEEPFSKQMDISALKQRNDYVKSLRRAQLGESAADIFFAQDEAYDDYMLERLAIQQNTTLSLDQRKQALARAEQDLPEKMQTMRKQVTVHADLSQNIKALRKEGASDNEIFQARSDVLGADAAVRLAQLDEKRALWQQRLDEYVSDRDQIKSSGLSKEDQHLALNNLLEQNFQGRDQLRVRALDANL